MGALILLYILLWGIPIAVADQIGKNKGYNNLTGFMLGFLLGWIGVLIMLVMPYKTNTQ